MQLRSLFAALVLGAWCVPCVQAGEVRHFEDAALHAVQFMDAEEGWAVGDEGVVWHTIDGGKTWERQPTGVRASLRSLHFLNPYVGWVVGREELPGGGSVGVLLLTRDGGLKWHRVHRNTLPGLNHVRFVDVKTGFVVGDGSDQFPSGVFTTIDAGRTWRPIPGPRSPGWLASSFEDEKTGALVGAWNRLATLREGMLGAADVDALGGRNLRGLQVNGKHAVAVGQGGLVLLSETAGVRWSYADLKLPAEVRASWDFHAVHCRGDHIWVAGRPGSALLHSSDKGKNWEVLVTGQPLPLNGIHFADEKHGWVVGEFGSILATLDGGKNWKVQRRGGQRAAVLFVHARPAEVPLDTVASLGAQDGYLTTALRISAPDPASAAPSQAADAQRWASACNLAGGASGEMLWQFPLPQHLQRGSKKEIVQAWDRLHADKAADQLLRQMVLALRTWKPAVVVTDHPDPAVTGFATDALVAEALHEAFARAADPNAYPEQIQVLGLEPWQVGKLYGRWEKREGAHVVLDTNEIQSRLGTSSRDFTASAGALLAEDSKAPTLRFYRLLESQIEGSANHRRLMDGVNLNPGGTARRELPDAPELSPELLKAVRERRTLEALAENSPANLAEPEKLLARIQPALATLPDDQASDAAFAIASQYARMGQWTLAREIYLMMVDRYPAHPRAADAYRWLIRYNSSSEARRRHEMGQFLIVSNLGYRPGKTDAKLETRTVKVETKGETSEGVRQAAILSLSDRAETRRWNQGCLDIGKRLDAFGPLFAADPSTHLCLNAARRNLGEFEPAQEWYKKFRNEHADGPWRDAAAAELWLTNRIGVSPKPFALCRQTSIRPFLDGDFNDPCWKDIKPTVMRNAAGDTLKEYSTEAWLAYDKDFLYVALRCRHPEGRQVQPVKGRKHDDDLKPYDRVSLLLDLDRDYATYFHLQVDQRGCVFEDCWGDRTWDPRWFVAVKSEPTCWQIEAAIPMTELTGDVVTVGRAWSCNVVRVVPGRGVQAMSLPADVQPRPEGMGLLLFVPEEAAKK